MSRAGAVLVAVLLIAGRLSLTAPAECGADRGSAASDEFIAEGARWVQTPALESNLFVSSTGVLEKTYAAECLETGDGGYVVTGNTGPLDGEMICLLKYDEFGSVAWARTAQGSLAARYNSESVALSPDGGFLVAGWAYGTMMHAVLLAQYDSGGELRWIRSYSTFSGDMAYAIRGTRDGGYIVGGYDARASPYYGNVLLMKCDVAGNVEWSVSSGSPDIEKAEAVAQTADDGYVVAGYTQMYTTNARNPLIARYDCDGALLWSRVLYGAGSDYAYGVQQTSDGGYIMVGACESWGAGIRDMLIVKFDSDGAVEWARTAGGTGHDTANSVRATTDGGYIIAGESFVPNREKELLVLKLNAAGDLEWARAAGGTGYDYCNSAIQTADGGYLLAGTGYPVTPAYRYNVILLRLNAAGQYPGCAFLRAVTVTYANLDIDSSDFPMDSFPVSLAVSTPEVTLASPKPTVAFICSLTTPTPTPTLTPTPAISPQSVPAFARGGLALLIGLLGALLCPGGLRAVWRKRT